MIYGGLFLSFYFVFFRQLLVLMVQIYLVQVLMVQVLLVQVLMVQVLMVQILMALVLMVQTPLVSFFNLFSRVMFLHIFKPHLQPKYLCVRHGFKLYVLVNFIPGWQ